MASRTRVHHGRAQHGAAAVEFALVMMPLLVLLFGAVQYGLYFWSMQGGSDIARSAARMAAVGDTATKTCTAFRSAVRGQVDGVSGTGSTATVTRSYADTDSEGEGLTEGDTVRISVQFKSVDMHFPFVPFIHDGLVTSTAEARIERYDRDHPPEGCS
ncbi:Flp pilus assembly protein TadG [Marmoricola sp. URHA0025 HA25]